jgi:hypothetical protein
VTFHAVSIRSPMVDLAEFATIFGMGASAAHLHAADPQQCQTPLSRRALEGPSSTFWIPAMRSTESTKSFGVNVVLSRKYVETNRVDVGAKLFGGQVAKLFLDIAVVHGFLQGR